MSVIQTPAPEEPPKRKLSRRHFLTGGIVGAGLLGVGTLGYRISALPDSAPAHPGGVLTRAELATVEALAMGYFPPDNPFGIDAREADVATYMDRYLSQLTPVDQKIIRSLFWVYDQGSLAHGRFASARFMTPAEMTPYLMSWEASRLEFRRDLALSLRTVIGLCYFAHPDVLAALEITPHCPPGGPSLASLGGTA